MTALALPMSTREESVRWSTCFAAVVFAHGLAAWMLLHAPPPSEFNAGAPMDVTLDLSDVVSAPSLPNDVEPVPETDPTPPLPEEQPKPIEPEAELALPMPEPPRPLEEEKPAAQPSVAAVATTTPTVAGAEVEQSAPRSRWESLLVAHIERFKRYPAEARSRGEQGIVQVFFTIDREGWVRASRVLKSSGYSELDNEVLSMLVRAQPMPKPPGQVSGTEMSFAVPVHFTIR
jgi:periplasmic protein TonB